MTFLATLSFVALIFCESILTNTHFRQPNYIHTWNNIVLVFQVILPISCGKNWSDTAFMTFWKLKASLMTCGGQNHVIWLQITYIDFKRLIIKLFVAMILHICVCCTSLFFSTRPQKSATLPPFLTEVLLLSRSVSKKGGNVKPFFRCLEPRYYK